MPKHSLTLPDIEQSVSRPIIYAILDQLFDIMSLSKETRIFYAGKNGTLGTPGTTIDGASRDAIFANDRYTFVEVDELYQPGAMQEMHTSDKEHHAIFLDSAIGLSLRPIYATSDVTIQIRYQANSETEARRWYAGMNAKAAAGRDMNLHKVMYRFGIPFPFSMLIEDAWALREKVDGYGDSFKDYVTKHASPRLTLLANLAGEKAILAIKETQTRVIGMFDFAGLPDVPVRDTSTGSWTIAFTYKFSYQRPDAVLIEYPISVHNQFLPGKYLDESETLVDPMTRQGYYSASYDALSIFEGDRITNSLRTTEPYFKIPEYDHFKIPDATTGTATIFMAMCFLDEDKKILLNMKDLGDIYIDPDIMEFLVSEVTWMTHFYQSIVNVTLYCNDVPVSGDLIEVLSDMTVQSKVPLSYRNCYRLRFSVVIDYKLLDWAALVRLGNYPKAAVKLISAVNALLRNNPDFKLLENVTKLEPWHLTYLYWVMTGGLNSPSSSYLWNDVNQSNFKGRAGDRFIGSIPKAVMDDFYRDRRVQMMTVMTTFVITHHTETPAEAQVEANATA